MAPRSSSSSSGGGIDLLTLVITAVASAAAAYTCSKVWAPGTLPSAAFTPVLVALIKEALDRPAKAVTQAVPVRGVVRSAPGPTDTQVRERGPQAQPEPPEPAAPSLERVAQQGEISYHSAGPDWSDRRWRVAVITGLLGFVVAVVIFTVPELVSGRSIFGGGGQTTLFGGQHGGTKATMAPARTVTVPPAQTVTAPPVVTVTAPPVATTPVPAPAVTTPAPPAATTPEPAPSGAGSSGPTSTVQVPIAP